MMCFSEDSLLNPVGCCGWPVAGMQTGTCSSPVVTLNATNTQNNICDIANILLDNTIICIILWRFVTIDAAFERNQYHVLFVLLRSKQFCVRAHVSTR